MKRTDVTQSDALHWSNFRGGLWCLLNTCLPAARADAQETATASHWPSTQHARATTEHRFLVIYHLQPSGASLGATLKLASARTIWLWKTMLGNFEPQQFFPGIFTHSSGPGDASTRHQTKPSVFQIALLIACSAPSHYLSKAVLVYCQFDMFWQTSVKFETKYMKLMKINLNIASAKSQSSCLGFFQTLSFCNPLIEAKAHFYSSFFMCACHKQALIINLYPLYIIFKSTSSPKRPFIISRPLNHFPVFLCDLMWCNSTTPNVCALQLPSRIGAHQTSWCQS